MTLIARHLLIDGSMTQLLEEEYAASKAADAHAESDAEHVTAAPTENLIDLGGKEDNIGAEAAVEKSEEAEIPAATEVVEETTAESAPAEVRSFTQI